MPHTNELQLLENRGWDARILVCRNGKLVDTFIVVTERFVVLVDTVINPQTAVQMLAYAQPYLVNGRQLLVVNTHADYDHCWGESAVCGGYGRPACTDHWQPPQPAQVPARESAGLPGQNEGARARYF